MATRGGLSMSEAANFAHQEDLFDPRYARKVTLIGAGSVGSYAALFLAKMGVVDIEVWDADVVLSHNAPASLYSHDDIGRMKVKVLGERILQLTGVQIKVMSSMYSGEELRNTSVIACVDTMAARKMIWEKVKLCPTIDLFCETRVNAWFLDVFAVAPCNPEDIKKYEDALFSDKEVVRQLCGQHGVVPVSVRAAQVVVSNFARFWQSGQKKWRHGERADTLEVVF